MKWVMILGAMAVGALTTGHAVGGEPPREVAIDGKLVMNGRVVARNSVGNPMSKDGEAGVAQIYSYDEKGKETFAGPFPLPLAVHCFGFTQVMSGTEQSYGYCTGTDSDGDQILMRTTAPTHPAVASPFSTSGEALFGTGKYVGYTGALASACESWAAGVTYETACADKGAIRRP